MSNRVGQFGRRRVTHAHARLLWLSIACLAGGGVGALSGCVRYDTNRDFYGRDSLVLKPDGGNASRDRGAVAAVREDPD